MRVSRNAYYLLWPQPVGCVTHIKTRYLGEIGYSVEPTWDVRPVVAFAMDDSPESVKARGDLLATLPKVVAPKTVGEVEQDRTAARAAFTRQEAAQMREQLRAEFATRGIPNADEVLATKGTGSIVVGEFGDQLPDGHPAKPKTAKRNPKAGAA